LGEGFLCASYFMPGDLADSGNSARARATLHMCMCMCMCMCMSMCMRMCMWITARRKQLKNVKVHEQ
jgi:hypothetical protein